MTTTGLMEHAPFRVFCVCCAVLLLKMIALTLYAAVVRRRYHSCVDPEDARLVGAQGAGDEEHPLVQRIQRAQRSDVENILPFFSIGLLFVLGGATLLSAQAYFITFTVARIFHSWCYLAGIQPWRSINFAVGLLCLLGMLVQLLLAAL